EIWKLVDAGAAQEPSERMRSRIIADLEDRPVDLVEMHEIVAHLVRAVDHGPQFEHLKATAVLPHALLSENRTAAGGEDDSNGGWEDDRCGQHEQNEPETDVGGALDRAPRSRNVAACRRCNCRLHAMRSARRQCCVRRPSTKSCDLRYILGSFVSSYP